MAKIAEVQEVSLNKLKPYKRNAKIHGEDQLKRIAESIREFGFISPCLIDREYNIIAGHGRVEAAKMVGLENVPCVFIEGLTEAQRRAYVLADNKLSELADWDMELVNLELQELDDMDFVVELTGFEMPEYGTDWFDKRERFDNSRQEGNDEYNEFLDKFEEPKTTDDCYTPDNIYDVVANYVAKRYGKNRENFVRPFYPGGDYQQYKYRPGSVVVDNPPFSILAEILKWYEEHEIEFFLFAPTLTLFSGRGLDICYLPIGASIVYENGASVNTSFITNLEDNRIHTLPDLYDELTAANKKNKNKKNVAKYEFPESVVTAASLSCLSVHGVEFSVRPEECVRVSELDAMKDCGKAIFGGGFLLSDQATARHVEAEKMKEQIVANKEIERLSNAVNGSNLARDDGTVVWGLSDRELAIVKGLGVGQEGGADQ